MLRGIATVTFAADDLGAASAWYSALLGVEPYFNRPGYVEFRIGDYQQELGIIDRRYIPPSATGPAGAVVYWHVDDLPATLARWNSSAPRSTSRCASAGPVSSPPRWLTRSATCLA